MLLTVQLSDHAHLIKLKPTDVLTFIVNLVSSCSSMLQANCILSITITLIISYNVVNQCLFHLYSH